MPDMTAHAAELDFCAREPIHIPGSIQPHGYLFILNADDLTVAAASENVAAALGVPPGALIGQRIVNLLAPVGEVGVEAAIREVDRTALRVRLLAPSQAAEWDCVIHSAGQGLLSVALGPRVGADGAEALLGGLRYAIERIRRAASSADACDALAAEMRRLTGFERVMIYRFDADWNGEVIAENKAEAARSYLGHAFPAGDIPAQARALYLRNTVRLIPDALYTSSPLFPAVLGKTGAPIDLSSVSLRSVSPVHLEYLANMGVAATMSISILRDGRLWGLAVCHNPVPRLLPNPVLQACELLTQAAVWYLDAEDRNAAAECCKAAGRLEAELNALEDGGRDYREKLAFISPALLDLTKTQGLAICDGQTVWTTGQVPSDEQILSFAAWLHAGGRETLTTNCLAGLFSGAETYHEIASGAVARRLPGGWLFCFRAEWPHTLIWAGDMSQALPAKLDAKQRIGPRKSFAAWQQSVRRESRPWTARDLAAVDAVQSLVLRTIMTDQMHRLRERKLALEAYHERTAEELRAASMAQIGLLPSARLLEAIMAASGLDIAGRLVSCNELGGDLWGIRDLGMGRVGVYAVDFAGHGTTAALNTFRLHTLIPEFIALLPEPARFLKALNMRLAELLPRGNFATMFYGVIDPNANCLTYAAAGAPPPIIRCGRDLALTALDSRGLPLGISASADYASRTATFNPGAALHLYSDVLIDGIDESGDYAGEAGAFALVSSCAAAPTADAVVDRICASLFHRRTGPLSDDLTVVCIKRP